MFDINRVIYSGIKRVIDRGYYELLEKSNNGIFIKGTIGDIYMIANENLSEGIDWIEKHKDGNYDLVNVCGNDDLADYVKNRFGFKTKLVCYQCQYNKDELPEFNSDLIIKKAKVEDIPFIQKNYRNIAFEECKFLIDHDVLFVGFEGDERVGFIGEHLEGSIGMLFVLEEYRKKGYGYDLECFMIRESKKRGFNPNGQVIYGNTKSLNLQKKMGMDIAEEMAYWIFGKQDE